MSFEPQAEVDENWIPIDPEEWHTALVLPRTFAVDHAAAIELVLVRSRASQGHAVHLTSLRSGAPSRWW